MGKSDMVDLGACPICGRRATPAFRPFCTKRCADVDLSRWLGEVYRAPVVEDEDDSPTGSGEILDR